MIAQAGACGSGARGVTLLEVVLAMGLLIVLSTMTYWFYTSSLDTRRADLESVQRLRLARTVLDRMATEFRQIVSSTSHRAVAMRGEPERIWFSTIRLPAVKYARAGMIMNRPPEQIYEFDQVKIEYKVARHPDIKIDGFEAPLGLSRIEITVPRKDSAETGEAFEDDGVEASGQGGGGVPPGDQGPQDPVEADTALDVEDEIQWSEIYSQQIRHLRFCYFDGKSWWDKWDVGGENPLPQLIQVTIGFEPHPAFGGDVALTTEEEEFCTCMNDPVDVRDCAPLAEDRYTLIVRLQQADMFFRSRVTRESQALLEDLEG